MPIPEFKSWREIIEFDDMESLTDVELLTVLDLQLEGLEKLQAIDDSITDQMIQTFKAGVNAFALASLNAIEAEKAAAIAKQKLEKTMDKLLAHDELQDGIPIASKPKVKGN